MSATVDTSLATFDVETLMTKAFELTHRIHEARHPHDATLRDQRDAIVREMKRRSEGMIRALVTVEAAERTMRGVDEVLCNAVNKGRKADLLAAVAASREALDMGMERTTTTTCSLVKDQSISDRIAAGAREQVRPVSNRMREMLRD